MSNRKWLYAILPLLLLFAWLLLRFTLSYLRIHQLVVPLEAASQAEGNSSKRIVLISQETGNYFWQAIEQGARSAAGRYGMRLEYIGPERINPSEQIKLLDKAIDAKADAILIQGINDPEYRALIDKAAGLGIPVITVDTDEPGSKRLAYVGTDNEGAGREMGELVAKSSGAQGEIGVLIGNERAENQRLRLAGFREVIGRYPQLHIVEVRSSDISRLQAAQQAQAMLARHPEIRYMVGFSSLDGPGILEASERAGTENLHIFAFDDKAETLEAVQASRIESTIVQQPAAIGTKAVELLHQYFNGDTPPSLTYTRFYEIKPDSPELKNGGEAE